MFDLWPLFAGSLQIFLLAAVVLSIGCSSRDGDAAKTPEQQFAALGQRVYRNQCATCHRPDGRGIEGVYPTLHGTEWVEGDVGRLIRLTLHGVRGPMEIHGEIYDQVMVPHDFLTDRQIAAVLTYVRSHFGNDASPVTADQVTAVRDASTHRGYYTPDVLRDAVGIPDTTDMR